MPHEIEVNTAATLLGGRSSAKPPWADEAMRSRLSDLLSDALKDATPKANS